MTPTERQALSLRTALAALGTAFALCSCKTPPPPPPPPQPPIVVAPVLRCDPPREIQDLAASHLLATQDRLSVLNTADLTTEANRPIDPTSVEATMDQALALSMTRTPGDIARAQALLDGVLHNNTPQADAYRGFARLLAYRLAEQRRAEENGERLAAQLRDQQRDSQRKVDQLNDKLEALKAIERNLSTRPAPKSTP